jgi:formate dehydrogenase maturation protein FdhE
MFMSPESASSNSRSFETVVHCERCGAPAELSTLVHPLGGMPGARIHHCSACHHMTWVEWWGWHGQQPRDGEKPQENKTAG